MLRVEVVEKGSLDLVRQSLEQFPGAVKDFAKREVRPFVSRQVNGTLRVEPARRPVDWRKRGEAVSERQRLYVIINVLKDESGRFRPYQRTGKTARGWSVRGDYQDDFSGITISNNSPAAPYVYGSVDKVSPMQPYHEKTGWPTLNQTLQSILLDTTGFIEERVPKLVEELLAKGAGNAG